MSKARPGKVHDKKQLDEEKWIENIPDEVAIEGDLGFQGLQNEFVNVHLQHKKPRGKELTDEQKQENREFSSQRVKCEHAHAGMKRYNSVTAVYRNRVPDFDDRLMLNAAGFDSYLHKPPVPIQRITAFLLIPAIRLFGYKSYYAEYDIRARLKR